MPRVLRSEDGRLEFVFWRAGAWCVLGAVPMLIGAAVHGHAREALWALAVAIEIGGAGIGFPTPGIGRSATREWTIDGRHFAERCQAFVLIALGESIVVSGGRLSELLHAQLDTSRLAAFGAAFVAAVALWWVYSTEAQLTARTRSRDQTIRADSAETPSTGCTRSSWPGSS